MPGFVSLYILYVLAYLSLQTPPLQAYLLVSFAASVSIQLAAWEPVLSRKYGLKSKPCESHGNSLAAELLSGEPVAPQRRARAACCGQRRWAAGAAADPHRTAPHRRRWWGQMPLKVTLLQGDMVAARLSPALPRQANPTFPIASGSSPTPRRWRRCPALRTPRVSLPYPVTPRNRKKYKWFLRPYPELHNFLSHNIMS